MKKIKSLFMIIIMNTVITGAVAQKTATASSSATIVTPIGIAQSVDMNFGNVATNSTGGTVVLTTGGSTSITGGLTLPTNTGTITAAAFEVTGEANYTYTIALTMGAIILQDDAGTPNQMTVDSFVSNPDATGALTSGVQTVNLGATLNVAGGQAAGIYRNSGGLTVTVNYN
jgi:ABC-type oligopeptide transport system substrate-binding subunit